MLYIGIDWADRYHQVHITDESADPLASFSIPNSLQGFQLLSTKVTELGFASNQCLVALETSSGLLVGYLLEQGFTLYPINPKAVNRYRDRFRVSGAKSDPLDAMVLAHILVTDRGVHRPLKPSSPLAQEIRIFTRDHKNLVKQRTRLVNQLAACLKEYYPGALSLFSSLDQPLAIAFLKAFPTPSAAHKLSLNQLEAFCFAHCYRVRNGIQKLHSKLLAPVPRANPFIVRAKSCYLLSLLAQLEPLLTAIAEYQDQLHSLLGQHPDCDIFLSLPRTGTVTAARMLAELGDNRENFPTLASLQGEAGTAPVTRRSGQRLSVVFRRACRKPLRDLLQQFARQSIIASVWAKEYYHCQTERGKSHSRALRALANRWLAIIWRIWQDRSTYDESYHLANRQLRKSRGAPMSPVPYTA